MNLRLLDGGKKKAPSQTSHQLQKQNLQIENVHSSFPQWLVLFTWLDTSVKPVEKIELDILCLHTYLGDKR